jgi:hypothetical protein
MDDFLARERLTNAAEETQEVVEACEEDGWFNWF